MNAVGSLKTLSVVFRLPTEISQNSLIIFPCTRYNLVIGLCHVKYNSFHP
jgi:hypothetical protein